MTATTSTFANTAATREAFLNSVNSGMIATINGRDVHARFGARATGWQNGSVSVSVRGRGINTLATVWIKDGQTVTVTFA